MIPYLALAVAVLLVAMTFALVTRYSLSLLNGYFNNGDVDESEPELRSSTRANADDVPW